MSTVADVLCSPGRWCLDPGRSTFGIRNTTMWGLMTVKGGFREFRGEGKVVDSGALSDRVDKFVLRHCTPESADVMSI